MRKRAAANNLCADVLDFAFKVLVHQLGITIGAFNPAMLTRNLQPDTRMTQRAAAAITGHAPLMNDLCLGCGCGHDFPCLVAVGQCPA